MKIRQNIIKKQWKHMFKTMNKQWKPFGKSLKNTITLKNAENMKNKIEKTKTYWKKTWKLMKSNGATHEK